MRLRSLMTRLAASTVLIAAAIGAQAAPSISGRELAVGASDVQQYLDGSFPRTQDALGGLIALTMSHPQLSLPAGERLNLGMDVALATAGGNPAKLGTVKLSSGLRYDAQTQGFHLQQPSVDDFTPASQGGRLDSRTRGLLNAWLSDYAQREPIYKLDPAVAGLLGALQVQSAQVKNGKLVVTFNQNLGDLVPAGVLGTTSAASRRQRFHHRLAEGRNVIGLAAGDQVAVHHHFRVAPARAGIGQVLLQRRPRGDLVSLRQPAVDQQPGAVADRRHRLAGTGHAADEIQYCFVGAQGVWTDHATGQHQRIETAGVGAIQWLIHGDRITPVLVLPALDARLLGRRHHAHARALRFQQVLGLDQFGLLETMRGEDGDLFAA